MTTDTKCCCAAVATGTPIKTKKHCFGYCCGLEAKSATPLYSTLETTNCPCVQLFLGDNTSYNRVKITETDKVATQKYCQSHNKTFYVHCALNCNLGNPDKHHNSIADKSVRAVISDLNSIQGLPGACVLHIGAKGTIADVAARLNTLDRDGHLPRITTEVGSGKITHPLLLELSAGQGTSLGKTWEELRHLYEALDRSKIGFCLDTAHVFAAGMCEFTNDESVVKLFEACHDVTGTKTGSGIGVVHINDSAIKYGGKVDRHAPLGQGKIWSKDLVSLKALIGRCYEDNIDLISETPNPKQDLQVLQALVG